MCVRDDGFDEIRHKREVIEELDYRNSEISLFSSTINELINRGYFVIRMGRNSKKQLSDEIAGYYDYSSQEVYDEVIELGVFALSEFTISTEYGVDEVAAMFRKPVILLNHLPVGQVRKSYLRPYSLPKRIIDIREMRELTVSDLLLRKLVNLWGKSSYSDLGCMYLDNSHEEVLNALKEYLEIRELIKISKERLGSTEAQIMLYPNRLNQPVVSSFWVDVN
jgi:putative glycosyltransferase (TIGR04372 family)